MEHINDEFFKKGFKDSNGNTLIFFRENGRTYLNVDGNECCEGIEEETNSISDTLKTLEWYGYNELAEIIKNNF